MPAARNPLLDAPGMATARERVEERLRSAVETPEAAMTEMASHLITAGGKRLRPLLAVAAAASSTGAPGGPADDGTGDDAVTGGVAVELVHIGSLYHDDVIDEAETRRGAESVNARWGNLRAILAGDFLLARASELAASLGTEVAGLLAATIGRLCEGEVRELQRAYQVDRTEADYRAAIEGKTASLFATACRIGGIVADLPRDRIDALGEFGLRYGVAFQIVDDVLDVVATDAELGKPAGHDMAEGVYNLPVLRALAGPGGDELAALLGGPLTAEARASALALVRAGDGVAQAMDAADDAVESAVAALASLSASPAGEALAGAARHLLVGVADRV
ncbi:MAG TPA: polyprenyl synthetase family protein [Acidimicrobiales bacterium]|nr:polyprenyl synthetase family protein [Acidimicrobiales bacterium]